MLRPVLNTALRRFTKPAELADIAAEVHEIAGPEVQEIRRAVFLPNQLEKITASTPHTELSVEMSFALADTLHHAPVLRYDLADALVHGAGFDQGRHPFRNRPIRMSDVFADFAEVEHATYCLSHVSYKYFGHWLQDSCATALLADPNSALILDHHPDWHHARDYLDAFQFSDVARLPLRANKLVVYSDFAQGTSKRTRYRELRDRLSRHCPTAVSQDTHIYFRRGSSGAARSIANEAQLTAELLKAGFQVFDLEGASVPAIYDVMRSARCVVSMDGSHLNHLYYAMAPGGSLLTIVPSNRFTMTQVGYAAAAELNYGFVVAVPTEGGYEVDPREVLLTVDRMQGAA